MSSDNENPQTGPRTPEGKERSSQNAVIHGLTAKRTVIHDDEQAQYDLIRETLLEQIDPGSAVEVITFNELLHSAWNLHRIQQLEERIFSSCDNPFADEEITKQLERLGRYQAAHRRSYYRALKELKALQTNAVVRTTLPDDVEENISELVDVTSIHVAKQNQVKAWSNAFDSALQRILKPPSLPDPGNSPEDHPSM